MLITQPGVMIRNIQWVQVLFRTCNFLSRLFPKVFCTGTLTWAVYALLVVSYENINVGFHRPVVSGLVSVFGVILYVLCVYSYWMVMVVGGGSPLEFEQLRIRNIDSLKQNDAFVMSADDSRRQTRATDATETDNVEDTDGEDAGLLVDTARDEPPTEYVTFHLTKPGVSPYRYCLKCKVWKPDRCHHCSTCGVCVLKMDHHCPWFATCVGYHNQKYFIQHLIYNASFSSFCFWVSGVVLYQFFTNQEYEDDYLSLNLVFLFVLGIVFMVTLSVFGMFTVWLVTKNKSTIEFQDDGRHSGKFQYEFNNSKTSKKYNIYDVGRSNNWKSVMGPNIWYWMLPIPFTQKDIQSRFNGINFPVNEEVYDEFVYNLRLQEQLNKQLADYRESTRRERLDV